MSSVSLQTAYAPFVASLLGGVFAPPADGGWTAELVAAHIVLNNDLIAATAERVAAGEEVAYYNGEIVEDAQLARYAAEIGSLAGLAREVERSAARLERAGQSLGERADTPVHVNIRDGGEIVQDGPMPIGALVEGNASFHLGRHLDQLKALEQSPEAEPPSEFDEYQLVLLERGPNPPQLDDEAALELHRRHLGHFRTMRAAGLMMVAGPIGGDEAIAGICLYRAGSVERARALAEDDPAVRAGKFVARVMQWNTGKDALRWPE